MPELVKLTKQISLSDRVFCDMIKRLAARREGVVGDDELLGLYPETVAESYLTGSGAPAPDCLTCGACCAYFQEIPVAVTDATPRELTWQVWESGDRAGPKTGWLRREPHRARCVALAGRVGARVSCAIYPLRPKSCREFEAGSDRCHAVRRLYGLEPRLSEAERDRHTRLVMKGKDAVEDSEDQEVEVYELKLGSAKEQIPFLLELIDYNDGKLDEAVAEIEMLCGLLGEPRFATAKSKCLRALGLIRRDAQSIRAAMSQLPATDCPHYLKKKETEELCFKLLKIGLLSQEALDRASRRVTRLGKIAFELLGLQLGSDG
jgi:Fe-S-cluster containining protein